VVSKKYPKITVVTPAYNDLLHIIPFLASLREVNYPNLEVIIIDDGSTDRTSTAIKQQFPEVIVLQGNGDLWWSGATNKGVKESIKRGADFIFTVNNDVLLDVNIFSELIKCASINPMALIGCKILYLDKPKKVWYFGAYLDDKSADIKIIDGQDKDFRERKEVQVLTGMGVLIPKEVFSKIGFYDDVRMPQYLADSDFSLRAADKGYRCLVEPNAKLYSDVNSSWVNKQLKDPKLVFIWQCYFARRSPYSIPVRYTFYRRHWGKYYMAVLFKFYILFFKNFIVHGFLRVYISKKLYFLKPVARKAREYKRYVQSIGKK